MNERQLRGQLGKSRLIRLIPLDLSHMRLSNRTGSRTYLSVLRVFVDGGLRSWRPNGMVEPDDFEPTRQSRQLSVFRQPSSEATYGRAGYVVVQTSHPLPQLPQGHSPEPSPHPQDCIRPQSPCRPQNCFHGSPWPTPTPAPSPPSSHPGPAAAASAAKLLFSEVCLSYFRYHSPAASCSQIPVAERFRMRSARAFSICSREVLAR